MPTLLWTHGVADEPKAHVQLMFEPRDLWLGIYWTPSPDRLEVYLCIVPMFPLKLTARLSKRRLRRMREALGFVPRSRR